MGHIFLPPEMKKLSVAEAFRLVLEVPAEEDSGIDVYVSTDGGEQMELRQRGRFGPFESLIQGEFLNFCKRENVNPICPSAAWSTYTGESLQNGLYEISVDEFRRFAKRYGISVELMITVLGIGNKTTMTPAAYQDYLAALARRKEVGRYTLEEAAMTLCSATAERGEEMLSKLMAAALTGELSVYEPEKNAVYRYGPGFAGSVRQFYEEARWDELNVWLTNHERHIEFEFPKPEGILSEAELEEGKLKVGVSKHEILCVNWPLPKNAPPLRNLLKDTPNWIEPAITRSGLVGKGKDNSHKWNPATLAHCLSEVAPRKQWTATRAALRKTITTHYPQYLEQWEAYED